MQQQYFSFLCTLKMETSGIFEQMLISRMLILYVHSKKCWDVLTQNWIKYGQNI